MALSGIEIFKKLPQTNCGDCGVPTCLAFAMKLAAAQAELDTCPHVSEEAKAELSESSAPPVRGVTIGVGDRAFKLGEETVLFRHDKTFVNKCVFALMVDAGASDGEIDEAVGQADALCFTRVQQDLTPGSVAIKSSGDAARFAEVAERVAGATGLPLVLMADDADAMKGALEKVADKKPLIHAATEANLDAMIELAKAHECPLAIKADGLEALTALTEKAADAGLKDLVLDSSAASAADSLRDLTLARRAAIEETYRPLGYPWITFPGELAGGDARLEVLYASMHVCKYGGVIVLSGTEPFRMLPLLVLTQNIYTDPQRPMQVKEDIYEINDPDENSPLMVTTNFSLTYFIVSSEIEASRVPTHLAVVDAEGLSVLTAWAAGKFVPEKIASMLTKFAPDKVSHKRVVIPGLVAQISGELKEELEGWDVVVGPAEATEIQAFLKSDSAA
jgi:acetyl-CoA decarbonylase/synthase complex subunit gamma